MYLEVAEVKKLLAGVDSDQDDDYQGTAAQLDNSIIETHIKEAQAIIDNTLSDIYSTPFEDPPETIKFICRAFASYYADLTYKKTTAYQSENYPVIRRYNIAKEQLELLRTQKIELNGLLNSDSLVVHAYDGPLFYQNQLLPKIGDYVGDW